MRAGSLRHRVTLRKRAETDDGHGGFADAPTVVARRIPASVEPLLSVVRDRNAQIDPRATHRVVLRYRTGVDSGLEVIYHDQRRGDRTFEIVGKPVDPDERQRELQLHCMEATAAA